MSDAQKLIAEVVRAHALGIREWSDSYRHRSCMCPQEVGADEHADHVAIEVDKALGGITRESGCDMSTKWIDATRFVSGWTVTE